MKGKVKWFDDSKGYGFLTPDDNEELSVFVHYTAIVTTGFKTLAEGQVVTFEITDVAKGPIAINVVKECV